MAINAGIRAEIAAQIPEKRVFARYYTYPSALSEIADAAYNRRMTTLDYVGRAALAFAVFDSAGEVMWDEITELEPPMTDITRLGFPRERLHGRGHGQWQIARLR